MAIQGLGGALGMEEIELLGAVGFAMMKLAQLPENPHRDRCGGYFTLLIDRSDPEEPPSMWKLGDIPEGEIEGQLIKRSENRALWLRAHPVELSSAQGNDPDLAGAIAAGQHIFAFADLKSPGNEAIVLVAAIRLNLLDVETATRIARLSDNNLFQPLLEACSQGG